MKILRHVWFGLASLASAAAAPLPVFSEKLTELPALSLADALKGGRVNAVVFESAAVIAGARKVPKPEAKRVSAMPVIPPPPGFASNMPVLAPDAATDFKLVVKEPEVGAAK
jgi:hypothetical protein